MLGIVSLEYTLQDSFPAHLRGTCMFDAWTPEDYSTAA
jgi:hypothetical protein